jgi:hypothetical protein
MYDYVRILPGQPYSGLLIADIQQCRPMSTKTITQLPPHRCNYQQSTGAIQPHRGPTGAPQGLSSPTGTIQPQKQTLARSNIQQISIYIYTNIYIYI